MAGRDSEPTNDWADAETRVERAHELYEQGRWAEAAAELQAAISVNPYNASWQFNLALTFEALEQYDHACRAYRAALELAPEDLETLNCLGVNLTRMGQYAEALDCFGRIERLDPTYEPSYCNRIVTYAEMGQHDEAEVMFYLAQQLRSDCPLCFYNIGNSLAARGDYERAIYCWRRTLHHDPRHPQVHARIAEARWAQGDARRARRHYEAELQLHPDNPDVLVDYGELLGELDLWDEAERVFRKALACDADHAPAHFCLGDLALRRKQPAVAERYFRQVLRLDGHFPSVHMRLAAALIRRGQVQAASRHLVTELRRSGDEPAMLEEIGQLLLEAHLTRQANAVLRRVVDLHPGDAHARHNLAVSFFRMRELDEGIRHCRKALKLRPDYPLALYNLALAHAQKGQYLRARRYAARAMTLAPADPNIRRLRRRLGLRTLWTRLRGRVIALWSR